MGAAGHAVPDHPIILGDASVDWLDGGMRDVRAFDLGFSAEELAKLARTLRRLHTMNEPWHEQSVRGGTQTERPLLLLTSAAGIAVAGGLLARSTAAALLQQLLLFRCETCR